MEKLNHEPIYIFFRYRFVFGFSPEGEHKVRPYIGFGHWLGFGFCLRQHFPLTFTYAHPKHHYFFLYHNCPGCIKCKHFTLIFKWNAFLYIKNCILICAISDLGKKIFHYACCVIIYNNFPYFV